jgi:hypothetical protein
MDRPYFYEANKTSIAFFVFSMIFCEFCKIFVFYRKREKRKKRKRLAWAWSSPQRSRLNCNDSAQVEKKSPPEETTFFSKTIKAPHPFSL